MFRRGACAGLQEANMVRSDQVQGDVLVLYVYQLRTDVSGVETVGVEKVSFRKQNPTAA